MRPTAAPAHITMHVRAAVSVGEPFAPRGDALADPGVARDEIRSFRADAEPLVLRVAISGGRVADRRSQRAPSPRRADGRTAPARRPR